MIKRKDGFRGEFSIVLPGTIIEKMKSDVLLNKLYITDIGYYPNALYHYRSRKQPIGQYVLIYCVGGAGWYSIDNVRREVAKDRFFILPVGKVHQYASLESDPWTIYWVHIGGSMAPELFKNKTGITFDVNPDSYSRIGERIDLFDEIFHTLEFGYSRQNLIYANSSMFRFLTSLIYIEQYRNAKKTNPEEDINAVSAVIHFMKENLNRKISLLEMADNAGYTPSYFSFLFIQQTGYSPVTYYNQLKMQKACHLLDFTNMKVNQISAMLGINDCYYFSRLFKKVMGTSPAMYRKRFL